MRASSTPTITSVRISFGISPVRSLNSLPASLDGYAYSHYGRTGVGGWPTYGEDHIPSFPDTPDGEKKKADWERERERRKCTIKRDECFGSATTASGVFKEFAFNKPECGDCGTCLFPTGLVFSPAERTDGQ